LILILFRVFTHACSVWLTCYLAFYRFITITHCVLKKIKNEKILKQNVTKMMGLVVLFVLLFMLCNFFAYDVKSNCSLFLCDSQYIEQEISNNRLVCPDNNNTYILHKDISDEINLHGNLL